MTRAGLPILALLLLPLLPATGAAWGDGAGDTPLHVVGNAALSSLAAERGWRGAGTAGDPYVLPPLDIALGGAAKGPGVLLQGTSHHVRIDGMVVSSFVREGVGIHLSRASNVTIADARLDHLATGILIDNSRDVRVLDSSIHHSRVGLHLLRSSGVEVRRVDAAINDHAFRLEGAETVGNVFRENRATTAEGQYGFWFAGPHTGAFPWGNDLGPTNEVDGHAVQWYTGLRGATEKHPVVLQGLDVRGIGTTNVAQLVCHRCQHVVLADAYVTGGTRGIVVVDSEDTRIERPTVEETGTAIEIRGGWGNRIVDADLRANDGGILVASSRVGRIANVSSVGLEGSRSPGVEIAGSRGITVTDVRVSQHGTGLHASEAHSLVLERIETTGGQEGIRLGRAPGVSVDTVTLRASGGTALHLADSPSSTLRRIDVSRAGAAGVSIRGSEGTTLEGFRITASGNGLVLDALRAGKVRDGEILENRLAGVVLRDAVGTDVSALRIVGNGADGVTLQRGRTNQLHDLDIADNRGAGVRLDGAGTGNRLERARIENHSDGIRIGRSPDNHFVENEIVTRGEQVGIRFDDDESYEVVLDATNRVDGVPVLWLTRPMGTHAAPLRLENLTATGTRVTNVAQIMLYKTSHVIVANASASDGLAAGLLVHGSSNVTVEGGAFPRNAVGVGLVSTRSSIVRDVDASGSDIGLRLVDTASTRVQRIDAQRTRIGVEIVGLSRQNEVDGVGASYATSASIRDASAVRGSPSPHNFVLDAGLDKRAAPGAEVVFADALVSVPFDHEAIVHQRWDFGDGDAQEREGAEALRVAHGYADEGDYMVTYTARTASGRVYTDHALVVVREPPPPAPDVVSVETAAGVARVTWAAPAGIARPVSYELLRAQGDGEFLPLARLENETTYLDRDVEPNATYRYTVRTIMGTAASPASPPAASRISPDGLLSAILGSAGIDADALAGALADVSADPTNADAAAAILDAAGVRDGAPEAQEAVETVLRSNAEEGSNLASQSWRPADLLAPEQRMKLLLGIAGAAFLLVVVAQMARR